MYGLRASRFFGGALPRLAGMHVRATRGTVWRVNISIQHRVTGKFLRGVDSWGDTMDEARRFATSIEAFRLCSDLGLGEVSILVDRGPGRPVIAIPVDMPEGATRPMTGFPSLAFR